jgi:hypothetical protein
MIVGGTPKTIAFGGESFKFTGDNEPEIDDGIEVTRESNADKTARKIVKVGPWMANGCTVECNAAKFDRLIEIKNSADDGDVAIELHDGVVLVGTEGGPSGTIKYNPAKATATFDVSGTGDLKRT